MKNSIFLTGLVPFFEGISGYFMGNFVFKEVADQSSLGKELKVPEPKGYGEGDDVYKKRFSLLCYIAFVLLLMILVIGGITRLTGSGLSITEWDLFSGIFPPLSQQDWEQAFASYKNSSQFKLQNNWMDIADFKNIYWWEWLHRFLGRILGLLVIVPFLIPKLYKIAPRSFMKSWFVIFSLIALQGVIGWWMVESGLLGKTSVSHYRLAIHLVLAFIIAFCILWLGLSSSLPSWTLMQRKRSRNPSLVFYGKSLLAIILLQIAYGALVSGSGGGLVYLQWPLMGDGLLPEDAFVISPVYLNFIENPPMIQFMHRVIAYLLVIFSFIFWLKCRRSAHKSIGKYANRFFASVLLQLLMGIGILVHGYGSGTLYVKIFHQSVAMVVFLLFVRTLFEIFYPRNIYTGHTKG